ncbi:MAG: Na+/H+ antiporter subunit G [Paracoccaceae bacterium]
MPDLTDIIIAVLLVIGGIFTLIGSFGLLKLRDGMQRLHAPTKGTTVGVGTILIASSINFWLTHGQVSIQEILIVVFLFVTAPLTALFLSKAQLHAMQDRSHLPPTGQKTLWATFEDDPEEEPQRPDARTDS